MHLIFLVFGHALIRPLILWPVERVGHAVRELWRSQPTADWYVASGTVFHVRAKQKGYLWRVWLGYHYSAAAHRYSGVARRVFVFERDVDKFLLKHPKGSLITLRYCPERVSRSVVWGVDQRPTAENNAAERAKAGTMYH